MAKHWQGLVVERHRYSHEELCSRGQGELSSGCMCSLGPCFFVEEWEKSGFVYLSYCFVVASCSDVIEDGVCAYRKKMKACVSFLMWA